MPSADLDIHARAKDDASAVLKHIESQLGGLGGALRSIGTQAAGFMGGMIGLQALGGISGMIQSTVGGMIGMNAEMETMSQSFKILLSDQAAMGPKIEESAGEVTAAMQSAAESVRDAQERMADAATDHQYALGKLAAEFDKLQLEGTKAFNKLAKEFQSSMSDMGLSHSRTMANLEQQMSELSRAFAQQSDARRRRFDEEMASLRSRYAEQVSEIKRRNGELARTAPDRFLREREAAKRNAEVIGLAIEEEEAKGTSADRTLLASLRARLQQEQVAQKTTFSEYQALEQKREAEELAAAKNRVDQATATTQARFTAEEQIANESHARQVAAIQKRMADEETEFTAAMAKRQQKYNEDLAAVKEAEAEKIKAIEERVAQEKKSYERTLRDARQAIAAAGRSYGEATKKTAQLTGQSVNQMDQLYANLGRFVGRELKTAEDRTAAMLEFITKKAKSTPFEIPDIQKMVQRLIAYQLDATQFLDTVGNVAAGMKVPVNQVADAFGALATGQLGEAVMRFREFGVNLKNITGLKFDAQGALVTPTEEALKLVKAAMDERFKGMMESQMNSFMGVVSNLKDAWGQFQIVMGKPVFAELRKGLQGLMKFIDDNDAQLKEFGKTLGEAVGDTIRDLAPIAKAALTGFFDWVKSGDAKKAAQDFGDSLKGVATASLEIIRAIRDLYDWYKRLTDESKASNDSMAADDRKRTLLGLENIELTKKRYTEYWEGLQAQWHVGELASNEFWDAVGKGARTTIDEVGLNWSVFTSNMGLMWTGLIKGLSKDWEAFKADAKTAINAAIVFFNTLIQAWNDLAFEIPSIWVPGIGQIGGGKIETPDLGKIPLLDNGGIVRKPTLAALAMNGRPEAVVPLDRAGGGGWDYDRLAAALARQPQQVRVYLDSDEVYVRGRTLARIRGREV